MRLVLTWLVLGAAVFAQVRDADRDDVIRRMDGEAARFAKMSRQIWEWAEIGYQEQKSSALLAEELRQAGFRVETGVAGMPTAFVASWGQGKPVIAILGEYDALPGLSQDTVPEKKPIVEGANGHGCGHNTFGVATAHAAIAAKRYLEARKIPGTVRFYGTPAEEGGGGKIHMIRAGLFKDVDAAITWHPWDSNAASNQNWLATVAARFKFTGKASHAAVAPWVGRSALDAALVMTHAVDLMREHVPPETRIHYIFDKTGAAVNIVPENAEVVLMARHPDKGMLAGIWERVLNCAQAGATAAGTQMSFEVTGSYANMLSNRAISSAIDRNLRRVGGYKYTPEEQAFAEKIRKSFSPEPPLSIGTQEHPLPIQEGVLSGSTDVGDVSWNLPTSQMLAATWVPGTPAHTWQSTAASGMSIGEKGMMVAAKTLALTAIDLIADTALLGAAKAEFQKATAGKTYTSIHPVQVRLR